jgi:hypothetical protein
VLVSATILSSHKYIPHRNINSITIVSGEAPKQPVVSLKSGNVFEKNLIEKYIADNGRDPINNEEMTVDDLIDIKTSKPFIST